MLAVEEARRLVGLAYTKLGTAALAVEDPSFMYDGEAEADDLLRQAREVLMRDLMHD